MEYLRQEEREEGGDIENEGGEGGGEEAVLHENYGRKEKSSSFLEYERDHGGFGGAGGESTNHLLTEPLLKSKSRINTTSQIAIIGANVSPIESLDYE